MSEIPDTRSSLLVRLRRPHDEQAWVARRSGCDPNRVRSLLQGQLLGAWQAEMEAHLETCEGCRHELETLAASADWWADVRRCLGRPSQQSNPPPTIAAGSGGSQRLVEEEEDSGWLTGFPGLLEPSDNPAMLGRLGGYEIVAVIGRGGMGVVLKGFEPELDRYVAIKILAPQLATSASDQPVVDEQAIRESPAVRSDGEAADAGLAATGAIEDTWELSVPEMEQIGTRLAELEQQMGPVRDSGSSVVAERFSEVQVRLQKLERDLNANGP